MGHAKLRGWSSTASTASTATPGLHDAGTVPTRVLRNEATLPLMCAGGREWVESLERPWGLCVHTWTSVLYTLFRQSEAAHNRYENDINTTILLILCYVNTEVHGAH